MSAPVLVGKLRVRDETGQTLRRMEGNITGSLRKIGTIAAGILTRDLVRGFVSASKEGIRMAAQVETLHRAFKALTAAAGNTNQTLDNLRQATKGTVGDVGLLTAANNALALGLPVDQLNEMFEAAMTVGHAMGRTTLEAINDVATGIGRQSRLILDNLGIIVDSEFAYKEYAKSIGKAASALTEAERKTAFHTAAIKALTEKAATLAGTTSDTQIVFERWAATVSNLKQKLGEVFLPILTRVVDALTNVINTTSQVIDKFKEEWFGEKGVEKLSVDVEARYVDIDWATVWSNISAWWDDVNWEDIFSGLANLLGNLWNRIIYPSLQSITDISIGFLNWFADVDWENVFQSMSDGMAKFWPIFQDAVGDLTELFTRWFVDVRWGEVFASMGTFASEFNKFFYKQLEQFQQTIGKGFWEGLWAGLSGGSLPLPIYMGGHAGGLETTVTRPTMMLVGEAGPERVSVGNAAQVAGGGMGYNPTFVFHIGSLSGSQGDANTLGKLTAEAHLAELKRRGYRI